jgi:putative hydrolase of the HAD superfamily
MTDEEFESCWNAMIYDFPIERIVLIERLRGLGKKVYLLSNINELHEYAVENSFSRLKLATSFRDLFNKLYYSHRIGLRKPKQDVFEFVLRDSSLVIEETLFIDDSQHHVIGARKAGIDSIHLQKPQVLEDLGIFKF